VSDDREPPVNGMTKIPCYWYDPLMMGAFISLGGFLILKEEARESFKNDTGHDLTRLMNRSPIVQMVDRSSGFEKDVFSSFLDWVCEHHWGQDGIDDDPEQALQALADQAQELSMGYEEISSKPEKKT
jgi:hypothetical protein